MWGAKTIGISLSLVSGTWIINHYGFQQAVKKHLDRLDCIEADEVNKEDPKVALVA